MSVASLTDAVWDALSRVQDPEIHKPITELGMVESVEVDEYGQAAVAVLLTISGCPMQNTIEHDVHAALRAAGPIPSGALTPQVEEMRRNWRALLAKNAENALAQKVRLQAYASKKDYNKVIELGEAAAKVQTDPEDVSLMYLTLGAAYNAKEMKPQAIEAFRKVTAGPAVESAKAALAELTK